MISLPIDLVLPDLREALANRNEVILEAPPGAGKTTRVPLALLNEPWLGDQKIIMLEPRRLAARAAAERLASELGEKVGETVGYHPQHRLGSARNASGVASCAGSNRSHSPLSASRNVGMPLSADAPAPVKTTTLCAALNCRARLLVIMNIAVAHSME